ncbi:MAG: M1 family metallopeptidase [Gemmatimonadota bacterium]|nr:MAG: M1 family metallopeptidase [Gemmatimonadota bacterium]
MQQIIRLLAGLTLLVGFGPSTALAQTTERPIPYPVVPPADFQAAVQNGTRTTTGEPGPNYWQQWTDYTLRARLLPEEKRIEGSARLLYHNNSPDDLPIVVLQLIQNLHAEGMARNRQAEITGGIEIERVTVADSLLTASHSQGPLISQVLAFVPVDRLSMFVGRLDPGYYVEGTTMPLVLPTPLASGDSIEIEVDWSFTVPQRGAPSGRMGWNADNLFHIAYWYPQMAVYDDVVGWQIDQFLGNAEFYMGYGSYDLTVEAPQGWMIMATGELMNAEDVLQPNVLERYRRAHGSDEVVHVLTAEDIAAGMATKVSEAGPLNWRFHADTVRDVVFSAMRKSQWDAVRTPVGDLDGDGTTDYTLINSFWRAEAPLWVKEWDYARHSIAYLSKWTGFPYPWPHMTSVEGGGIEGGGMEYPMMTLMGDYTFPNASERALYGVTSHELAHMWVPMIVGTDERRYSWMDEGTTSFNGGYASADYYGQPTPVAGNSMGYLQVARMGAEGEIMRLSDFHYPGPAYGIASYEKPAMLLNTLRALLGTDRFDAIYQDYIRTWAYKHPKPWDFFNLFSTASGQNLDWFWRSWYYEIWTLDQAVASVTAGDGGTTIVIENHGWVPMPARVSITLENGETLQDEVPVEAWLRGATRAEISVPAGSPVVRVEIDPGQVFPDIDRDNNVWEIDSND